MKRFLHAAVIAVAVGTVSSLALLPSSNALAQDTATPPAPTAAPTTVPAGDRFTAEARSVSSPIDLNGVFEPADALEVKIELDAFTQDMEVTQVAGHGASVSEGDVLLAVDPEDLQRTLKEARNHKALADINLSKAEVDAGLGEQSDALAARVAQRQLESAQEALSWFESVDGEAMLQGAEMMVERAQDSIEDQQDEIDQLQKMYKSEELTEDTADIVVKRALRRLRQSQEQMELTKKRADKIREKDYVDARQNLIDNLDRQKLQSAQMNNDQAQRKVQRESTMLSARAAAETAAEALAELEADAQKVAITAPADGIVYYGQINGGNWTGATEDALETGDNIKPGQVVATFFQPGRMHIVVDLPEGDRFRVSQGASATVTPTALQDVEVEARVAKISQLVTQKGPDRVFQITIELPAEMDPRIAPGFTAEVKIAAEGRELPVVPEGYVKDGKIRVQRDGKWETVSVKTGQAQDGMVQITEGIAPGEAVMPAEEPEALNVADEAAETVAEPAPVGK